MSSHPTIVTIHLDRLSRNLRLLQSLVGKCAVWPAIKANAYGHDAVIVARHLVDLGCGTLCVAHASEAEVLIRSGVAARFVLLSAGLSDPADMIVEYGLEPVVSELAIAREIARVAVARSRQVSIHVKVDTGMGRVGIHPDAAASFVETCQALPGLRVRGVMSHFPRADEADKGYSKEQTERFRRVVAGLNRQAIDYVHMANSAAIFDLPESHFDAVRPGIALYGLKPSLTMSNPRVEALQPVLEWKTRISFLKTVPAGTGLSYGHAFPTARESLIATIPCGYGDGLSRAFSNNLEVLVAGVRCPLVGRVTMDQSLIDLTDVKGRVELGDEVVIIGRQGDEEVTADELAARLGTINYEVVTTISARVPRLVAASDGSAQAIRR